MERTFAWLGRNRRLSKDYDYEIQTSETFIDVAAIRLMLKSDRAYLTLFKHPLNQVGLLRWGVGGGRPLSGGGAAHNYDGYVVRKGLARAPFVERVHYFCDHL